MKQSEVNFEVKNYTWTGDYQKDGEPTLYFEFNKSEYYGLVAVKGGNGPFYKRAIQTYIETVTGEEVERIEPYPKQISKSEAFLKFLLAEEHLGKTVGEVIAEFERIENGLVLIDGSLI
jgi:hypothetical protein